MENPLLSRDSHLDIRSDFRLRGGSATSSLVTSQSGRGVQGLSERVRRSARLLSEASLLEK